jgi:hypothetical protein
MTTGEPGYLIKEEFNQLMEKAAETGRIIGGLRASVEQRCDFQ